MKIIKKELKDSKQNAPLIGAVLKQPQLTRLWLLSAKRAQLALVVTLLLLIFAAPVAVSKLATVLYPQSSSLKSVISNVFTANKTSNKQLRELRYKQLLLLLWLAGLSPAVILLINNLPSSISKGEKQALASLQRSMRLKHSDPALSLHFYHRACSLVINRDEFINLHPYEKSPVNTGQQSTPTALDQTVVLSGALELEKKTIGASQRYTLDKVIAKGGMGLVYIGYDTILKRKVAIKELDKQLADDEEQIERFRQEALLLAELSHPNIVSIQDLIEDSGQFWFVMEYLSGGDLESYLQQNQVADINTSLIIIRDIAKALDCAHQKGLIHRDVKPLNILFTESGSPKVVDFGIAESLQSMIKTAIGVSMGSPGYMSPEQVSGSAVDQRSDIYSLGVTLFKMLTNQLPFEGDALSVMAQHVNKQPPGPASLNKEISNELNDLTLQLLSKSPDDRMQTMREVIAELGPLILATESAPV